MKRGRKVLSPYVIQVSFAGPFTPGDVMGRFLSQQDTGMIPGLCQAPLVIPLLGHKEQAQLIMGHNILCPLFIFGFQKFDYDVSRHGFTLFVFILLGVHGPF